MIDTIDYYAMLIRLVDKTNVNIEALQVDGGKWSDQFLQAVNVNAGNLENIGWTDYLLHAFAFAWKVKLTSVMINLYLT